MSRDLSLIEPRLRVGVPKILAAMAAIGYPMMVTDTIRTEVEQVALYAQGRTKPGPIVTNADGIIKKSNHQLHEDGFGHAVDCCFIVTGAPSWDVHLPWAAYGALAKALGFKWGGDWSSLHDLHDLPHIEIL